MPGNSLVGHETELAEVPARLGQARLVTLTGPGGVGKTRLALHARGRSAPRRFPTASILCELAAVATDAAVAVPWRPRCGTSAAAGRPQPTGSSTSSSRRALFVLDNCEHVLDGARA